MFINTHPGMTDADREAILAGDIRPGFSTDMVTASWGYPQDVIQEIFNGREVTSWLYQRNTYDYVKIYRVRFLDRRVNEVSLIRLIRRGTYYPYCRGWEYQSGPPFFGFPPYGYPGRPGYTDFTGTDLHYNADPYYDPW
jgi:hypothetical protein